MPPRLLIPGPVELEPEVLAILAQPVQAHYGDAWVEVHNETISLLQAVYETTGRVYMLPGSGSLAVDAAAHMLRLAEANLARVGLADRVQLVWCDAKTLPWPQGRFSAVMSNSIVHHIPEPRTVLAEAVRTAVINKRAGGVGLISGRKAFQRPMAEGIQLLNAIQDVYLCPEVTVA